MSVKQTLKCSIHAPEKWQDDYNGCNVDDINNLPNLAPTKVYVVDDYPACPTNWEHGSDIAGSYFVGLAEDGALWLDFNECFDHTHDVAVVLSVQGINPITGQTMVGDNPLRMEQYHKNCPVHDTPFKQDYFCEDCGFSWPGQNYMATTGTPFGMFWLDGFCTPDGKVRQYVISAEKMRSVAAQVMEKRGEDSEDRVFAIGVAFYLSKDKKPDMPKSERTEPKKQLGFIGSVSFNKPSLKFFSSTHTPRGWKPSDNKYGSAGGTLRASSGIEISASLGFVTHDPNQMITTQGFDYSGGDIDALDGDMLSLDTDDGDTDALDGVRTYDCSDIKVLTGEDARAKRPEMYETVIPVKKLEVGAGALVSQRVYDDPKNLKKYWEETPAGMIYINYCDEETLKKILDGGKKATKKDGFMDEIQVG